MSPLSLILYGLLIILLVTAATGFFVALEFAFTAADRSRLEDIAAGDDPVRAAKAHRALGILKKLSFTLSGAQLGITVTALFVGFFAEPFLGQGLSDLLGVASVPVGVATAIGTIFAFLLANAIQMVLGELAPKNLAIARTEALALFLARPTQIYMTVFGPIIAFFDIVSTKLLISIGIQPVEELEHTATTEDLHHIIDHSRDSGTLHANLSDLLDRSLDFSEITAEQAATARVNVHTLSTDATVADAVAALRTGHSRFPIVGNDIDDIRGVIGISHIINTPRERRETTLAVDIADPPMLVPASLPAPQLLEDMRTKHRQMACVLDEFGGFAGIVTLEDLAEELVGDIRDEADSLETRMQILSGSSWIIPGRFRIDEIDDATGIELPDSPHYETVSGLVMSQLGRIPQEHDQISIQLSDNRQATIIVNSIQRHVPQAVILRLEECPITDSNTTIPGTAKPNTTGQGGAK